MFLLLSTFLQTYLRTSGFSFEAGGRTFHLVVYQVVSGTLMPLCIRPFLFLVVFLFGFLLKIFLLSHEAFVFGITTLKQNVKTLL